MMRSGDWMQTYSGRVFWPLDPRAGEVHIEDIAHALALQCRYAGHTIAPYSVAEHSVRVSYACEPSSALWGLLHDAAEAYVVDVPRPIKPYLHGYDLIERRVMHAICDRFGIGYDMPESVHRADEILLATERRDLMASCERPWRLAAEPLVECIAPSWCAVAAEARFIARFAELTP